MDSFRVAAAVPDGLSTGIVHIGLGAFHRAHQAVYTEDAIRHSGDPSWGIAAVAPRSSATVDAMSRQDGLYSVITGTNGERWARVVGVHTSALHLPGDPGGVIEVLSRPSTRIVTLTVTEKGYGCDPVTGGLADEGAARAEIAAAVPMTVVGLLVHALQRRADDDLPVTVLCCDNLRANGATLRRLVEQYAALLPRHEADRVTAFVARSVAFPDTVVDRIVPATTPADLAEAERLIGAHDEIPVVAEPFSQWVMQDGFAAGRPAWERAGATFTPDVASYEQLKLRLVNAPHSALAYLGMLRGHRTIADSVRDQNVLRAVEQLLTDELVPTVSAPKGVDAARYAQSALERFGNPSLRHTTRQVAMDGSRKLPERVVDAVRERRAAGLESRRCLLVVAAWLSLILGDSDAAKTIDDPRAEILRARARRSSPPPLPEVLGTDLDADAVVRDTLAEQFGSIQRHGIDATLQAEAG
jgi:fructuronate reductase